MIICHNTQSGTWYYVRVCYYYYYINVVCLQLVLRWGTNRGCSINRGNTVCYMLCICWLVNIYGDLLMNASPLMAHFANTYANVYSILSTCCSNAYQMLLPVNTHIVHKVKRSLKLIQCWTVLSMVRHFDACDYNTLSYFII